MVQRQVDPEEEEEEEEPIQAKWTGEQTPQGGRNLATNIRSLRGRGQPLPESVRNFFEPRFSHDFSHVKIHNGPEVAGLARAVNARAFTSGRDIVFGTGQYAPEGTEGKKMMAHELVHVVQQDKKSRPGAPVRARRDSMVMRKVVVDKPKDKIPNPTGKGVVQTNAATAKNYLKTICSGGSVKADSASGDVSIGKAFCSPNIKQVTLFSWIPWIDIQPAPATTSKTPTGCGCLCDMVYSKHKWTIKIDDATWPHTLFDDDAAANGKKPGGTGGTVTAPSPNNPKFWGAATAAGKTLDIDPWLVLGHELCGHGWLGNFGKHGPDVKWPRGMGGHQEAVKRENMLRAEHGIDLRGTFKDPYCGESYWRDKKAPAKVNWSRYLQVCKNFRKVYNWFFNTNYKIGDKIP